MATTVQSRVAWTSPKRGNWIVSHRSQGVEESSPYLHDSAKKRNAFEKNQNFYYARGITRGGGKKFYQGASKADSGKKFVFFFFF